MNELSDADSEAEVTPNGKRILDFLYEQEAGFNELVQSLGIANNSMSRELTELKKLGYIKTRDQNESFFKNAKRGRPTKPFFLTEEGRRYVTVERVTQSLEEETRKKIRELKEKTLGEFAAEKLTKKEVKSTLQEGYDRIGAALPFALIFKIWPKLGELDANPEENCIFVIETANEVNARSMMTFLSGYRVRKEGTGPLYTYLLEPRPEYLNDMDLKKGIMCLPMPLKEPLKEDKIVYPLFSRGGMVYSLKVSSGREQ